MASPQFYQSRRFECVIENGIVLDTVVNLLKLDVEVSFLKWSETVIYVEVRVKKTVSYFKKFHSALELVRTCGLSSIPEEDVKGTHGVPMIARNLTTSSKLSTPEKLRMVFKQVLETKETPDLSEDVDAIINKSDFDKVITAAKRKNRTAEYSLVLRQWQKKALTAIYGQEKREILWIFDFDGNSGKTELSKYLRFKCNFHKLPSGMYLYIKIALTKIIC